MFQFVVTVFTVLQYWKGKETVLSAVVSPTWWSDQCAGRYGKNDAFLAMCAAALCANDVIKR